MIEDPARDAHGVLATAEQSALGGEAVPFDGDCHDMIHFITRIYGLMLRRTPSCGFW
ncbi:hypothetical protein NSU_4578 [Novosphingobium pentaromativorans US6-1]|uniref:Uncharacterized protein n=1 Tax=Novosphingobium pentaromativorans US6-1 TaxID=1088721 RepID=G6EJQ7_9SPHN|nr:hypothetical protein NSU_4578 [Novosphingobium pentaromativorans US6-1]